MAPSPHRSVSRWPKAPKAGTSCLAAARHSEATPMIMNRYRLTAATFLAVMAAFLLHTAAPRTAAPKFFGDDPLQREPETQDASKVQEWEIDLFWDLAENLFGNPGGRTPLVKSRDVNTI